MATSELRLPRETAELAPSPRETAEDRTFTEGEAYAIAADQVQRETAALATEKAALEATIATLTTEKAALQTELDVAVAAKEKAEQDLATYKSDQEAAQAIAGRKDERVARVREAAKHLKDDYFTAERAERWAAMETADFDAYVADLAVVSVGAVPPEGETAAEKAARETAMAGATVVKVTGKGFFSHLGGN